MVELRRRLQNEVTVEIQRYMQDYLQILKGIEDTFNKENDERVFMKGATNILMQPEFRDVDKVRDILNLFEQNELLIRILGSRKDGIEVRIGTENDEQVISNCSIITATYHFNDKPVGKVGVLGPTRMEYGKIISILHGLTGNMTRVLQNIYKD
jgi:heat-inducible transcriptional repressor